MRFLDIVFSYVWQVFFLHQPMTPFSVTGAVLVSLCLILIGMKKWWYVRKARLAYEQSLLSNGLHLRVCFESLAGFFVY